MLPENGKISIEDIFMETPMIKPINIKKGMDYHNLVGKTAFSNFYGKKEKLLKEALIFEKAENLTFQFLNRRPQTSSQIFNNWGRIKGNIFYPNALAASGDTEATAWYLENDQIFMPLNVEPINGFVSNMEFDKYSITCTLASAHNDNDSIGLIAAFHRENGNNYYLCFYANMSGTLPYTGIGISYNGADATHTTWAGVNLLYSGGSFGNSSGSAGHGWAGKERTLKIERDENIIKFWFSGINSTTLPIDPQFVLDLRSEPRLEKFLGKKKYGYMTNSQPYSTYKNAIFISNTMDENTIIDATNKKVYKFNYSTNNWESTDIKIHEEFEYPSFILNPEGENYNEKNWYEIKNDEIIKKGQYQSNTQPDITKIKNNEQFININETDFSNSPIDSIGSSISLVQRRNLHETITINAPIQNVSQNTITLNDINYNKVNITNLERSVIFTDTNKMLVPKYDDSLKLKLYQPKSWYTLNIFTQLVIPSIYNNSKVNSVLVVNDNIYLTIKTSNGKDCVLEIAGSTINEYEILPTPTTNFFATRIQIVNNKIYTNSWYHDTDKYFSYVRDISSLDSPNLDISSKMPNPITNSVYTIKVLYFKNKYYIFNNKNIYYSTADNITFTKHANGGDFLGEGTSNYEIHSVACNNNIIVLCIRIHLLATFGLLVTYTSTDGINWIRRFQISSTTSASVLYSTKLNKFILSTIVDSNKLRVTARESTDGITWQIVKNIDFPSDAVEVYISPENPNGDILYYSAHAPTLNRKFYLYDYNGINLIDLQTKIFNDFMVGSSSQTQPRIVETSNMYLVHDGKNIKTYTK